MDDIKRKLFPLTIEQFNELHVIQKKSISEIARDHNIKVAWISMWLKRNGLHAETKPTESANVTHEMLKADYKSGLSSRKIAKKYGISKTLVYLKLKKFGLETDPDSNVEAVPIRERSKSAEQISIAIKDKWQDTNYRDKTTSAMSSDENKQSISNSVHMWVKHKNEK